MGSLVPGGWPALMAKNHAEVVAGRAAVLEALDLESPCPEDLLGSMASVVVPHPHAGLGDRLFHQFHVEVPVIPFAGKTLVRISAQRHVRPGDVPALIDALRKLAPAKRAS